MHRRTLLRLPALGALAAAGATLTACGEDPPVAENDARPPGLPDAARTAYGADPSQFGELHLPAGTPRGVVVVIHGGFWRAAYDHTLGTPLAASLAAEGWAAWNLEYRRVGDGTGGGGGAPATFDDVAAGVDALADLGVDTSVVVTLGHSAGGHLAAWSAARQGHDWPSRVPVTHVVSQAGVLDLRAAASAGLGDGAATALLGHEPTTDDARYDPAQQLPLDVPLWCVHGVDDTIVPLSQSADYVAAATAAGATAELVEVEGDHFVVIDPGSAAWARTLEVLDTIA
ncbi:prolyl oligopeptidase family serine peptidase [Nocardioides sp. 1609]|uniref:alpha/beta hydrolase family protein n=1 Tax=Nocardioides sp. 1609 TaxID=2508327 RepID=UPI00106FAE59|nr:prolyl oligopeptidase family serine peptidase [Nocardioides sp. 1609]